VPARYRQRSEAAEAAFIKASEREPRLTDCGFFSHTDGPARSAEALAVSFGFRVPTRCFGSSQRTSHFFCQVGPVLMERR